MRELLQIIAFIILAAGIMLAAVMCLMLHFKAFGIFVSIVGGLLFISDKEVWNGIHR